MASVTPIRPNPEPITPLQKVGLLQAIAQLEMLSMVFPNAPDRVIKAHKEFVDSMKEWAS